jgi:hypothetical protein
VTVLRDLNVTLGYFVSILREKTQLDTWHIYTFITLFSNFRRVLNRAYFLLGISPASD